ncbi:uncharacterized protein N7496_011734 [Penicillium cataractarum]|uniref:Uncharacterized protein n=1 Tax=Penicillium cataractarum TaxID=2100454 RepID=A0A9W9UYB8_9EURO|nr:uncharacterized protein N7496_011734 [Penicillium cataractarum]KAJ5359321.1 hypothetical protein N7496_011734 [Penicillium cataractarum]
MSNNDNTFLRLPASIRKRIYVFAGLITDSYIQYPSVAKPYMKDYGISEVDRKLSHNLLKVCQQVHDEAKAILLKRNTCIYSPKFYDNYKDLVSLNQLGPSWFFLLRNVYVHVADVLKPFIDVKGRLLELELRLHPSFADQARQIVLQVQAPDPVLMPFRFVELPAEVRHRVLQYTDIVTPSRTVHWDPRNGFMANVCRWVDGDDVLGNRYDYASHGPHTCEGDPGTTGDFCMWTQPGSYSSRCNRTHRQSPLPLLLTCRTMYNDATYSFYTNNRIVILPCTNPTDCMIGTAPAGYLEHLYLADAAGNFPRGIFSSKQLVVHEATKIFVERVGRNKLRLIRTLEIVFPVVGMQSDSVLDTPAYKEWLVAAGYLKTLTNAQGLTLIIHIMKPRHADYPRFEGAAEIFETAARQLLMPLRGPPRLQFKRLFVHLESTSHWAPSKLLPGMRTDRLSGGRSRYLPLSNDKLAEMEVALKKLVMGEQYDSYAVGKGEELPSAWLLDEWERCREYW